MQAEDAGTDGGVVTCPRCRADNPADLKFCRQCWALLRGRPCPRCGRPATRVGALTCEYCGASLYAFGRRAPARDAAPGPPGAGSAGIGGPTGFGWTGPASGGAAEPPGAGSGGIGGPTKYARTAPARGGAAAAPVEPPSETGGAVLQEALAEVPYRAAAEASSETREENPVTAWAAATEISGEVQAEASARPLEPRQTGHAVDPSTSAAASPAARTSEPLQSGHAIDPLVARSRRPAHLYIAGMAGLLAVVGVLLATRAPRRSAAPAPTPAPPARAVAPAPAPTGAMEPPAPATGILIVESVPDDARVELNGQPAGATVLRLEDVPVGLHSVRIAKAGYRPAVRQVRVMAGAPTVVRVRLVAVTPARRRPPPPPPPPQ